MQRFWGSSSHIVQTIALKNALTKDAKSLACAPSSLIIAKPFPPVRRALEAFMEIRDALNLIRRIENIPKIYNKIEMAVCSVIHSYFDEMLKVEKKESAVMEHAAQKGQIYFSGG